MLGKNKKPETADTKSKDQKFITRISVLIASLKFLWFIGHVIVGMF